MIDKATGNMQSRSEKRIEVRPFRSWHIASYDGLKVTGASRTEAIAHLLLSLREKVEVIEIRLKSIPKRGSVNKRGARG